MAKIPLLKDTPLSEPSPRVRMQPSGAAESFGGTQAAQLGQLAGGITNVGQALSSIGAKLLADQEDAEIREGIAEYRAEAREALYGQGGILTLQGKDAKGATLAAQNTLEDLRKRYAKRFVTTRSQQAWDKWSGVEVSNAAETAARHEAIETRKWQQESIMAQIESEGQLLIDERDDDVQVGKREKAIHAAFTKLYGMYGKDVVKLNTDKYLSAVHLKAINEFLAEKRSAWAQKYYDAHQEALLPEERGTIKRMLDERGRQDEILARALEIAHSPMSDVDKLKLIDEEFKDAQEHAYAQSQMLARDAYLDRKKKEAEDVYVEDELTRAIDRWSNGESNYDLPPDFPRKYKEMGEKLKLEYLVRGRLDTDWDKFDELMDSYRTDYDEFRRKNLNKYRADLPTDVINFFKTLQDNPTDAEWRAYVEHKIGGVFETIPKSNFKTYTEENSMRARLRRMVWGQIGAEEVKNGDYKLFDEIIDNLMTRGVNTKGWDKPSYRFMTDPDYFYVPEPEAQSSAYRAGWGAFGPSDEALRRASAPPTAPIGPVKPLSAHPDAQLSKDKQRWEWSVNGTVIMAWDLDGNPLTTWPK